MTTPMRWADSDSDDSDDEYNVNEESSDASKAEEAPISSDNQQNQATVSHTQPSFSSRDNYNSKYRNDNKSQIKHQQNPRHQNDHQKGGNVGNYGGGSKNRPQNPQHSHNKNNWKQLAKASSRFSSGNSDPSANIDGSAWMAQRKAKMEQDAKEQKQKKAGRLQQEQEQKQSRRKSQLSALKAAMCEIKQNQVEEVSQKAGPTTSEITASEVVDMPSSNVRILKKKTATAATATSNFDGDNENRNSQGQDSVESFKPQNEPKNQQDDMATKGSWRRAKASSVPSLAASKTPSHSTQPPPPPKYNYTIGESPSNASKQQPKLLHKAELQPDRSSVKFTRDRSGFTDNKLNSVSSVKLSSECAAEAKGQEIKARVAVSTYHKEQKTDVRIDTTNGDSNCGDKGERLQRVIVAFDDASGHPSTEKKKNKKNKQEKIGSNSGESDIASSNLKSKCHDDNNDEEAASTKTSSSRGSSTLQSSSRSSRGGGGGGGKNKGRGNSQRRDSRSNKSGRGRGRGRGREGRGSQNQSNVTIGSNVNECEGRGNLADSGKRGATQATIHSNTNNNSNSRNGSGRFAGREGKRRDSQSGGKKSPIPAKEGDRSNVKREPSSGRGRTKGARGNDGRGGRGHKAGRGGQRNSGKDSSKSSSAPTKKSHQPKYSYEIGKD